MLLWARVWRHHDWQELVHWQSWCEFGWWILHWVIEICDLIINARMNTWVKTCSNIWFRTRADETTILRSWIVTVSWSCLSSFSTTLGTLRPARPPAPSSINNLLWLHINLSQFSHLNIPVNIIIISNNRAVSWALVKLEQRTVSSDTAAGSTCNQTFSRGLNLEYSLDKLILPNNFRNCMFFKFSFLNLTSTSES